MERLVLAIFCVAFSTMAAEAQLAFPQDAASYALGKFLDPLMVQPMKYKYAKKFLMKPSYHDKDLLLQAKYKQLAEKILARQMKIFGSQNCNQQNSVCERFRPMTMTNSFYSTNQMPCWSQQQSLSTSQNPFVDPSSAIISTNVRTDCPGILDQTYSQDNYRQCGGTFLRSQPVVMPSRTAFPFQQ